MPLERVSNTAPHPFSWVKFYWNKHAHCLHVSVAAFTLQPQGWVVATENMWSVKPGIYTVCLYRHPCQPYLRGPAPGLPGVRTHSVVRPLAPFILDQLLVCSACFRPRRPRAAVLRMRPPLLCLLPPGDWQAAVLGGVPLQGWRGILFSDSIKVHVDCPFILLIILVSLRNNWHISLYKLRYTAW